jgi:hypothetical protein
MAYVIEGRNEEVIGMESTTVTLNQQHFSIPSVTVALQSTSDINVFITSISKRRVVVEYSATFTGRLHLQAISVR